MTMILNRSGAQATVYTALGQVLRVPLRSGTAPERQFISWFNRQSAANPGFPARVKSILLVTPRRLCSSCRAGLLRFLNRYHLANKVRLVSGPSPATCGCHQPPSPTSQLEQMLTEAGVGLAVEPRFSRNGEARQLLELSQEMQQLTQEYESWFNKVRNTASKYSRVAKVLIELAKGAQQTPDHIRAAEEHARQQQAEQVAQNQQQQQRDAQARNRKPPGAR